MESLPKPNKKNIPKSIREMSKEMLQESLKKKKECNAKALEIVERLCDTHIDESWFLENLQFINQCHFDDVTVERSISKMCGYPLCDQQLKNVPTQQYHVSLKYNKVFDITERKNFCSSHCYKSAKYVKEQLFTSPLWFRDQEVIPKYKILKSFSSLLGKEMVFPTDKIKSTHENMLHTKVSNKPELEDQQVKELEEKYSHLKIGSSQIVSHEKASTKIDGESSLGRKETIADNRSQEDSTLKEEKKEESESSKTYNGDNIYHKNRTSVSHQQQNSKKNEKKIKNKDKPVDTVLKVEKSVFEWFSLHTLFYIYGEEKIKELVCEKTDEIKQVLNSKLSRAGLTDKIDRIIQLYGLLDTDLFSKKEKKRNLKPLPDYTALKKERSTADIKVRAFYQGQLEVKQPLTEEKEEKKESESNPDSEAIYLPMVDAHSQIPLRRKILLDKLNRVLPDLIKVLSCKCILQMNEVRNLVTTFTLGAHNITFKPCEWYLVGIIIIKLLSLKDKQLESVIKLECSENQILLILKGFNLEKEYLDNLLVRLTDSKNLLKKINEFNS